MKKILCNASRDRAAMDRIASDGSRLHVTGSRVAAAVKQVEGDTNRVQPRMIRVQRDVIRVRTDVIPVAPDMNPDACDDRRIHAARPRGRADMKPVTRAGPRVVTYMNRVEGDKPRIHATRRRVVAT